MSQTEKLIRLYIRGWTSHKKASEHGCGLYVWKRWEEWSHKHGVLVPSNGLWICGFIVRGKEYSVETRYREVRGVRFLERRLVRVK